MKTKGSSWVRVPLILAIVAVWSIGAATGNFDLPKGESESASTYQYPEIGLWPEGSLPEESPAFMEKIASETKAKKAEPTEYVVLREDPPIQSVDGIIDPEIYDDLPPIEKELQKQFFGKRPPEYLIDPQQLITEQKANDVLRFLEIHAEESSFKIYPIVIGRHQSIPDDTDLKQNHRDWFGELPTLLIVYKIRDPESLQFIYNEEVERKLPGTVFAKIRANCINEAKLADNGPDQLEKIAIELSIQAFWLEKLMARAPLPVATKVTSLNEIAKPDPVAKVDPIARPAELDGIRNILREWAQSNVTTDLVKWLVIGCSSILALAIGLFLKGLISKRRTLGRSPILFPGYHRMERLGGEFTGGSFVGISFVPGRTSEKD